MVAAPKIMTANEAEKLKEKRKKDHADEHGADHDCKHGFEEHYDKILVIQRPKEDNTPTVRKGGGGKLNSKLYQTARQTRELKAA